jgi:hypothetical protein
MKAALAAFMRRLTGWEGVDFGGKGGGEEGRASTSGYEEIERMRKAKRARLAMKRLRE